MFSITQKIIAGFIISASFFPLSVSAYVESEYEIPEIINGHLSSQGNIFIDDDYYLNYLSDETLFEAEKGTFIFLGKDLNFEGIDQVFNNLEKKDGVYFSPDYSFSQLIVAGSLELPISSFSAEKNIYIINVDHLLTSKEVPLPASGLLLATALLGLKVKRLKQS